MCLKLEEYTQNIIFSKSSGARKFQIQPIGSIVMYLKMFILSSIGSVQLPKQTLRLIESPSYKQFVQPYLRRNIQKREVKYEIYLTQQVCSKDTIPRN